LLFLIYTFIGLPQGRPFAWQEALIVIATIFQKFDFTASDPTYNLQLSQSLTLKPKGFMFRAAPQKNAPSFTGSTAASDPLIKQGTSAESNINSGLQLHVLYGSNTGSCEGFAQQVASRAAAKGACTYFGVRYNKLTLSFQAFARLLRHSIVWQIEFLPKAL
jgi:cytochrome P450/NADPH-cytochrome P450 reductase